MIWIWGNKELFLYTPNVKIHIFQILIFYKKDFNYNDISEAKTLMKQNYFLIRIQTISRRYHIKFNTQIFNF